MVICECGKSKPTEPSKRGEGADDILNIRGNNAADIAANLGVDLHPKPSSIEVAECSRDFCLPLLPRLQQPGRPPGSFLVGGWFGRVVWQVVGEAGRLGQPSHLISSTTFYPSAGRFFVADVFAGRRAGKWPKKNLPDEGAQASHWV